MRYFWFVVLFFIVAYLVPLAGRPLVTPDEFRYAEIPREMIANGDYVTPRLLDVRYFEKPVLGYWLTAGCFKIFGDNAFSIRLPAALGAGLAALLIWILVDQALRDRKLAALAAIFYLSCGLVYGVGTFAVLDSQTTAFITGILVTSYLAAVEPHFNRRKVLLLVFCGVFTALAFLAKGFIAFAVPALAMLGFLLWERRWKEFLLLPWIPLVVALALIAPWAIAIHKAEPDYWRYFIMIEHWQRFTADAPGQHPEPFWFLIPFLIGGVFPAALLLIPGFTVGRVALERILRQPLYRFCLSAVVLPFLFVSASSGKHATNNQPCFPPRAGPAAAGNAANLKSEERRTQSLFSGDAHDMGRIARSRVARIRCGAVPAFHGADLLRLVFPRGRRHGGGRAGVRRGAADLPACGLADTVSSLLRRYGASAGDRRLGDPGRAAR